MNGDQNVICPFCQGVTAPAYKMGDYAICQCQSCGTGQVSPMPGGAELKDFYNGFLFSADLINLQTILKSSQELFSLLRLPQNGTMKMLDVGGGGGFYAKAFEESGYGESTYVDLDSEACSFAREKIRLKNVLNQDAATLDSGGHKYDFIMCRHLIEHLVDPTAFILKLTDILEDNGTLLLVCPNGDSLEYFAYPRHLNSRVKKIAVSSQLSRFKVKLQLLTGKMLHGIDPPRHLWAISRKGMRQFLDNNQINAEITTFPLTDPAYSPYYSSTTLMEKIGAFFGNLVTSKIAGGTHLSIVIRKSEQNSVI